MRRSIPYLVLGVLVAAGLWFFRVPLGRLLDRFRLEEVEVFTAQMTSPAAASVASGISSNGYVIARKRAALSADTPGRIVELNVEEGQVVEKGFVVARLFAEEYAAALEQAKANESVGHAALERSLAEENAALAEISRLAASHASSKSNHAEARANLRLAELRVERTRPLVERGIENAERLDEVEIGADSSAARVAAAEAAVAAAHAALEEGNARLELARAAVAESRAQIRALEAARTLAAATLEKTIVRAPFDGIVVLKDAEVGEVVSPNSTAGSNARGSVATMVDFDSLEVQAEVPETSVAAVEIGRPARVYLDAYPGDPYDARVDRIWPTANRQKATIEVRVAFLAPDDRLRPEMGVRVVFLDERDPGSPPLAADDSAKDAAGPVLLVPASALVAMDGQSGVFVLDRDVARFRSVTTGGRRGDRVVISSGLSDGERVLRAPSSTLADGDRVREKSST